MGTVLPDVTEVAEVVARQRVREGSELILYRELSPLKTKLTIPEGRDHMTNPILRALPLNTGDFISNTGTCRDIFKAQQWDDPFSSDSRMPSWQTVAIS